MPEGPTHLSDTRDVESGSTAGDREHGAVGNEPFERLIREATGEDRAQAAVAHATLKAWHEAALRQALESDQISPQALAYIAGTPEWPESLRATAVSHPAFPAAQLQAMLRGQEPTTRALLLERARRRQDFELLSGLRSQGDAAPELQQAAENLMVEILAAQAQQDPGEERSLDAEDGTEPRPGDKAPAAKDTAVQRLAKMAVSEKVRVALFGSKEERFILVKSVNRIIASAVLKSPKTTDAEIELISQMRNVHLEVLTTIANTPIWSGKRTIALNLIRNPRTPVAMALRLIGRVPPRDLQNVARDRGISEAVRRAAARAVSAANKRK